MDARTLIRPPFRPPATAWSIAGILLALLLIATSVVALDRHVLGHDDWASLEDRSGGALVLAPGQTHRSRIVPERADGRPGGPPAPVATLAGEGGGAATSGARTDARGRSASRRGRRGGQRRTGGTRARAAVDSGVTATAAQAPAGSSPATDGTSAGSTQTTGRGRGGTGARRVRVHTSSGGGGGGAQAGGGTRTAKQSRGARAVQRGGGRASSRGGTRTRRAGRGSSGGPARHHTRAAGGEATPHGPPEHAQANGRHDRGR